jgi:hypothetical protein
MGPQQRSRTPPIPSGSGARWHPSRTRTRSPENGRHRQFPYSRMERHSPTYQRRELSPPRRSRSKTPRRSRSRTPRRRYSPVRGRVSPSRDKYTSRSPHRTRSPPEPRTPPRPRTPPPRDYREYSPPTPARESPPPRSRARSPPPRSRADARDLTTLRTTHAVPTNAAPIASSDGLDIRQRLDIINGTQQWKVIHTVRGLFATLHRYDSPDTSLNCTQCVDWADHILDGRVHLTIEEMSVKLRESQPELYRFIQNDGQSTRASLGNDPPSLLQRIEHRPTIHSPHHPPRHRARGRAPSMEMDIPLANRPRLADRLQPPNPSPPDTHPPSIEFGPLYSKGSVIMHARVPDIVLAPPPGQTLVRVADSRKVSLSTPGRYPSTPLPQFDQSLLAEALYLREELRNHSQRQLVEKYSSALHQKFGMDAILRPSGIPASISEHTAIWETQPSSNYHWLSVHTESGIMKHADVNIALLVKLLSTLNGRAQKDRRNVFLSYLRRAFRDNAARYWSVIAGLGLPRVEDQHQPFRWYALALNGRPYPHRVIKDGPSYITFLYWLYEAGVKSQQRVEEFISVIERESDRSRRWNFQRLDSPAADPVPVLEIEDERDHVDLILNRLQNGPTGRRTYTAALSAPFSEGFGATDEEMNAPSPDVSSLAPSPVSYAVAARPNNSSEPSPMEVEPVPHPFPEQPRVYLKYVDPEEDSSEGEPLVDDYRNHPKEIEEPPKFPEQSEFTLGNAILVCRGIAAYDLALEKFLYGHKVAGNGQRRYAWDGQNPISGWEFVRWKGTPTRNNQGWVHRIGTAIFKELIAYQTKHRHIIVQSGEHTRERLPHPDRPIPPEDKDVLVRVHPGYNEPPAQGPNHDDPFRSARTRRDEKLRDKNRP